ncbi:hypothetical protein HJ173_24940 [Vibrio parahaemolyticus]|nr:hypothetical protein [Vibrio parahaemolyticus]
MSQQKSPEENFRCAILAFFLIGPFVKVLSGALAAGVNFLVSAHLLPESELIT